MGQTNNLTNDSFKRYEAFKSLNLLNCHWLGYWSAPFFMLHWRHSGVTRAAPRSGVSGKSREGMGRGPGGSQEWCKRAARGGEGQRASGGLLSPGGSSAAVRRRLPLAPPPPSSRPRRWPPAIPLLPPPPPSPPISSRVLLSSPLAKGLFGVSHWTPEDIQVAGPLNADVCVCLGRWPLGSLSCLFFVLFPPKALDGNN